jgi:F-type H+-transporting ATPase subunit a
METKEKKEIKSLDIATNSTDEYIANTDSHSHNENGHTSNEGGENINIGDIIFHHILNSDEIEISPIGAIHLPYMFFDKDGFHFFKSRETLLQNSTYTVNPHKMPVKAERADGIPIDLDLSISKHLVFLWISFLILFLVLRKAVKSNAKSLVPKGIGNVVETLVVYARDEIVMPTIGKAGMKILPFFLTFFFFLLLLNMIGLIPYSSTATGNINVTLSFALITFCMILIQGIKKNGFFGYFKGLIPHGIPIALLPIMVIVEFLGLLTKPFALCIRLFANMTAGHVIILSLIGLIFIFKTVLIAPISIAFSLFIYLLEILVALIQAYIFTMLSALFVGMAIHQEH